MVYVLYTRFDADLINVWQIRGCFCTHIAPVAIHCRCCMSFQKRLCALILRKMEGDGGQVACHPA